jgi:glucokinase
MANLVTGVDIGGTHISVGLVDIDRGEVLKPTCVRDHIDTADTADNIIAAWAKVIRACHHKAGTVLGNIGIAMPGPFDYENGVSLITGLHKYESLYGLPVKELLAENLGLHHDKIKFLNDASAFLAGEMFCGCARGYKNLVGITLGTGLGSAAFYDNIPEEGDLYLMDYKEGKTEDYLSTRWFVQQYQVTTGQAVQGVKELASMAEKDVVAMQLFETFGASLASVLISRYRVQHPEIIVIGGNISHAWEFFMPSMQEVMRENNFNPLVKKAVMGEDAALAGAACLFKS